MPLHWLLTSTGILHSLFGSCLCGGLCCVLVRSLRECLCCGSFRGCLRGGFQSRVFALSRGTGRLSRRLRILTGCRRVLTGGRIL